MNPAQLSAWLSNNRTAVIGVGAAGAVGLGLLARRRAGGDVSAPAATTPGYYSGGAQVAGVAGTYDSSASDLYSALSPELAGIAQSLEKLNGAAKTPTPVPAPPKPPAPPAVKLKPGYYRDAKTKSVYAVLADGRRDHLTQAEYLALKKPKTTVVAHDQITSLRLIGTAGTNGKAK